MTARLDAINIGLILLSLLMAILLPFELFLWAYAILGPLHYITEINWLEKKKFFVLKPIYIWLLVIMTLLVAAPHIMNLFTYINEGGESWLHELQWFLYGSTAAFIFLSVALAVTLTLTKKWWIVLLSGATALYLGYMLNSSSFFVALFGAFLSSIVHVYIFTILFMLYGVVQKTNPLGITSVVLMLLVPLIIIFLPVQPESYHPAKETVETIDAVGFGYLKNYLVYVLGWSDSAEYVTELTVVGIKAQIFIAFAYVYHYLNWFSKTTVIGWHKVISKQKLVLLSVLWVASVGLYLYDYVFGFIVLVLLSFLHVLLELPLNWISIRTVVGKIIGK